jgi:UDP-N-acetylglucosamine 2-epimerase (non-hydrolysing)
MQELGQKFELVTIAGNRPELIKLSELVRLLANVDYRSGFVYTGQHYSGNMKDVFLEELSLKFDYDLKIGTSDVNVLRETIAKHLRSISPEFAIIYGDTNSTLAGALAAKDANCKVIHIEAGLRSFDLTRAEERNRMIIDAVSDYHLAPTDLNKIFLKYERPETNPYVTGNLIVDVCRKYSEEHCGIVDNFPSQFVLLTVHRQESVDDPNLLRQLPRFLSQIRYDVVYPIHPRTKKNLARYNVHLPPNVICIDAVGYKEFIALLKKCIIVITDSGGVQEEAVVLKRPCITLSNTTERQETLLIKANKLYFPLDPKQQKKCINDIIEEMLSSKITLNPYGENVTHRNLQAINDIILGNVSVNG